MTIEEMKNRKRELGYSNKTIAEKTGLPLSTVQKIFSGATSSPRQATIQALEELLRPAADKTYTYDSPANAATLHFGEAQSTYTIRPSSQPVKGQGMYTIEDYLALPDDQRVELIDGTFYDMAAPTTYHQAIAGYIYKLFLDFVLSNKGPCFPFISPVDVQLDCDDKTVVQPDVLVVCDRSKYRNGRVFGAPDLVIEVLSASTQKKDMYLKYFKYANAGVREYWMIDPKSKRIVQYDMEHLELPAIYSFEDQVPVCIWDKRCKISFREIMENIAFLFEERE